MVRDSAFRVSLWSQLLSTKLTPLQKNVGGFGAEGFVVLGFRAFFREMGLTGKSGRLRSKKVGTLLVKAVRV